jgi:hypothetical protein
MWADFKFAIDFREGDTKPVVPEKSSSASKSGSKSLLNEEGHYGEVGGGSGKSGKKKNRSSNDIMKDGSVTLLYRDQGS